jgi:hypothetical protein
MTTKTFSIRLDEDMLEKIKAQADDNHRPVNGEIMMLLEKGLEKYAREQEAIAALDTKDSLTHKNREIS